MSGMPLDPSSSAHLVCLLACVGASISSLEWLLPARKLARGGLFAGSVEAGTSARARTFIGDWRSTGIRTVLISRIAAATCFVTCFALGAGASASAAALLAGILGLVLRINEPVGIYLGLDGAEAIITVSLLTLGSALVIGSASAIGLGLAFVALQAMLEYASAGWAKLRSLRGWANGGHLLRVVASSNYGHPWVATRARAHPRLTGALSLCVIALEIAMPSALLLPAPYSELLLASALAFHLGSAAIMGFSTFVWGFAATFPAILYCRDVATRALASLV